MGADQSQIKEDTKTTDYDIKDVIVGEPLDYFNLNDTEKKYINTIHIPTCIYNSIASTNENNNQGTTKTSTIVGFTQGQNKPDNNPLLTDNGFEHDLSLEERCHLMKQYNDLMASVINKELIDNDKEPQLNIRYEKKVAKHIETCSIYRINESN